MDRPCCFGGNHFPTNVQQIKGIHKSRSIDPVQQGPGKRSDRGQPSTPGRADMQMGRKQRFFCDHIGDTGKNLAGLDYIPRGQIFDWRYMTVEHKKGIFISGRGNLMANNHGFSEKIGNDTRYFSRITKRHLNGIVHTAEPIIPGSKQTQVNAFMRK